MRPLAVDDVGEQERLALGLVEPAEELPAHQRVHLRILVDRLVDPQQQPRLVEILDVLVQVGITPRSGTHMVVLRSNDAHAMMPSRDM